MRWVGRVARSPWAWVYVFLWGLVLNAGVTALTGVPAPETHDEFSYLLAADTFAHGRVTNPTHPMWRHFETFHELQVPTYQSKYQPGQGLVLALGQVVTGMPIAGAWLSAGLAAGLVAWALRPVVRARWALVAGLMVAMHPLVMLWGQNYWGGSSAAAGGAMVFGAAVRLRRRETAGMAVLLGVGILVLFNTRPYEGLVLAALVVTPLLLLRRLGWRTVAVIGGVLGMGACWAGYYDNRVTGDVWRLPYVEHERQYALAPPFLWEGERPAKEYRHEVMREYNEGELAHYRGQRTVMGFIRGVGEKSWILVKAYGGQPVLAVGLLGLGYVVRRWRYAVVTLVLFVGALFLSNWTFAHYAAPGLVLLMLVVVAGLRAVAARWRAVLPVVAAVYVGTCGWWVVERVRTEPGSWGRVREMLIEQLEAEPGEDLVIVRERGGGNVNTEWVFNRADIDASPVVFARDMGEAGNAELIRYFAGRKVWLLDVGTGKIERYGS